MLYIGIDSGTQSTKSIVVDLEKGGIIATSQQNYGLITGLPEGHMEQDPKVWIGAVDKTIQDCLTQIGDRKHQVGAIGVSGQQHGLVVLNSSSQVIRPAKLWCDTSTAVQCKEIIEEFGGEAALIKLIGNTMLPGWTAPKILWLKQREPENFASVDSILLPHDYINFWLTGEKRMEYGDASGTGLLDVKTRRWCEPVIEFIDEALIEKLPPLGSSRQAVGLLRENLREKWGLKSSPVISAGGGDNMMGAIGTGNVSPGVVTASLGTSGTVYAYSTEPVVDPQGEVAAFCDSTDKWLPLVCTMNVTGGYRESAAALRLGHSAIERGRCFRATGSDRNHVPPLSFRRADAESAPRRRCVSWSDDEKYDARQSCQSYHGGRDVRISLWSEPVSLTGHKTFRDSAHRWR